MTVPGWIEATGLPPGVRAGTTERRFGCVTGERDFDGREPLPGAPEAAHRRPGLAQGLMQGAVSAANRTGRGCGDCLNFRPSPSGCVKSMASRSTMPTRIPCQLNRPKPMPQLPSAPLSYWPC